MYWLELIHIVRSVSVDRYDKIKERIRNRRIADYDGENVCKLATDYHRDFKELHGAQLYDHTLSITMISQLMKAEGANEDFRSPLRKVKKALNKKLLEIRHMNYTSAFRAMKKSDLDVQSILKVAKEEYRVLKDDGDWKTALDAKDSKALNKNYGAVNLAAT